MMRLYKNVKKLRLEAGMTQKRLAELTGLSQPTIAKIERGHIDVPHSSIMKLAEAFGVFPGDLMGWNEPDADELSPDERAIIFAFRRLNRMGKKTARERMNDLLLIDKYCDSGIKE